MTNDELIAAAAAVLKPRKNADGRVFGDVGAAMISESGALFTGVCIDTPSWGICAERSAIATMATAGEYRIRRVVAVWRDEGGKLHVVAPCGHCRQFMREIDDANLETEVLLGPARSVPLRELLPHHIWPEAID